MYDPLIRADQSASNYKFSFYMETEPTVPPTQAVEQQSMNSSKVYVIIGLLCVLLFGAYMFISFKTPTVSPTTVETPLVAEKYMGKKILFIDSYHEGYEWSDGITTGIKKELAGSGVELRVVRMDTKRNPTEEWKKAAAARAAAEIKTFLPDVLIVSDDNAFKYIVQESYKDAPLPVVFVGLNWDASGYGAPYTNTTGMVEVSLTTQIIDHLKPFTKGDRLGYLSADTETERKNLTYYEKLFALKFEKSYFVKDMESWKKAFLALQSETDLIIFENNAGILDWNDNAAEEFAKANIRVPVGTTNPWTMKESVLGITKIPNEQGEWAGVTTLRILDGTSPASIPIVKNEKGALYVNLVLAEKLGIVLPPNILKNAQVAK